MCERWTFFLASLNSNCHNVETSPSDFYRVNGIIDPTVGKKYCREKVLPLAQVITFCRFIECNRSGGKVLPEAVIFNLCFRAKFTENYPQHLLIMRKSLPTSVCIKKYPGGNKKDGVDGKGRRFDAFVFKLSFQTQ